MKKLSMLAILGLLFLVYACGGGGSDPKSAMMEYYNVMEDFVKSAENINSADDAVAAINKFSEAMKKMVPKMKALAEKYPELKNMKAGKMPEEFKEIEAKITELMPKFGAVFMKIAQYGSDPKVVEAQKKMGEAMQMFN